MVCDQVSFLGSPLHLFLLDFSLFLLFRLLKQCVIYWMLTIETCPFCLESCMIMSPIPPPLSLCFLRQWSVITWMRNDFKTCLKSILNLCWSLLSLGNVYGPPDIRFLIQSKRYSIHSNEIQFNSSLFKGILFIWLKTECFWETRFVQEFWPLIQWNPLDYFRITWNDLLKDNPDRILWEIVWFQRLACSKSFQGQISERSTLNKQIH